MKKLTRLITSCRWLPLAGRRGFPRAGIFLMLTGFLLSTASVATPGAGDHQSLEKGNMVMQPAAATPAVKDVPPLDRSQPSRVETFTFGLG
jgi:hypothetical protein